MNLRRVYIKRSGGEIASEACYAAWKGFLAKGYPLDFFEWQDLKEQCLVLDAATLVVGGTTTVHMALRQIGIEPPLPLNLPDSLRKFAGRNIWSTTLGKLREDVAARDFQPCFIKPAEATKSFPGFVVKEASDLDQVSHLQDNDMPLQASEPFPFLTEWRYFVHKQTVVGSAHYAGDWSLHPAPEVVKSAIAQYAEAPVAYAIDFAVTENQKTVLVEANDAFALGAHGIDPLVYASMLEHRWLEITRTIETP